MHNKKWSRGLKTTLSLTMASLILLPNIAYATPYDSVKQFKNDFSNKSSLELNISPIQSGVDTTTEKEISVIVEFKGLPTSYATNVSKLSKAKSTKEIKKEHEIFENFLSQIKDESKTTYSASKNIKYNYTNTFNGVALKIKGTDVEKLLDCNVVKNIWVDEEVKLDLPKDKESKSNEVTPYMENSKPHIGVDKLHEEGIKGKGMKVGVLDTGIDYNHPDLKNNYKGGYDFVDMDNDPMETTPSDWKESGKDEFSPNGSSYYTSHGTHVSGTIAATGDNKESEFATIGIAPEADLYGYRVLGPYGSGYTTDILAAIEKSVEDGMDVINLSLGASTNNPLYPTSVACNNAMLAGVITVVANGNSGPNAGTVGSPAASPLAISVGASSVDMNVQTFDMSGFGVSENNKLLGRDFETKLDSLNGDSEIVYCGLGDVNDFAGKNLKNKVALVERGTLTFNDKIINAKKAGAKAIIVYNNVDGPMNVNLGESSKYIPAIEMSKANGNKLKSEIEGNENATINIKLGETVKTKGDELADFSSRGPVINGNIKPDVVAPGVSILSTYPEFINHMEDGEDYSQAYARINGTSMASPHVAGVAALIKEQNKDYDPFDVKVALMNTSDDLRHEYAIHEVGAGKIDPEEAIKSGISIKVENEDITVDEYGNEISVKNETGSLAFRNIVKSEKTTKIDKELIINNTSNKTNTFDVYVDYLKEDARTNVKDAKKNNVEVNVKEIAVASKNKETKLNVSLSIPKDAEVGMYQGYINLESRKNKNEKYRVPFSVNYTETGIKNLELSRDAANNDLDWYHPFLTSGIGMALEMNEMVDKIHVLVKDFDTNSPVGYIGWLNGSSLEPNTEHLIDIFDPSMSTIPIKEDGSLANLPKALKQGKYLLELISIDSNGKENIKQQPFIVDTTPATVEVDKGSGVYEISEKDLTVEKDNSGVEHKAYWVHGKADDNSVEILKSMGVNTSKSDIMITSAIDGMPTGPIFSVDKEGNYKFGITMDDLTTNEPGYMELRTFALDQATALNHEQDQRYFFVEEGKPYLYSKLDKKEVNEGENITNTMSFNNVENASKFKTEVEYSNGIKLENVKINEKAKTVLNEKGYEAELTHKDISQGWGKTEEIEVVLKDKDGNLVEYSGDIDLVDIEFKVEDDTEFTRYVMSFLCRNQSVYNKEGKKQELSTKLIYDSANIYQSTSQAYLNEPNEAIAFAPTHPEDAQKYLWVEDNEGNKYDFTYDDGNGFYIANNLPISTSEYKVVAQAPGHFKREETFMPSRNIDDKLVGKATLIYGNIQAMAGDVDGNGAIDIHDAIDLAKDYGKVVTEATKNKDFNLDKKINKTDMDYIVQNFMEVNLQDENAAKPQDSVNGKTLDDVLKEIGYNN